MDILEKTMQDKLKLAEKQFVIESLQIVMDYFIKNFNNPMIGIVSKMKADEVFTLITNHLNKK